MRGLSDLFSFMKPEQVAYLRRHRDDYGIYPGTACGCQQCAVDYAEPLAPAPRCATCGDAAFVRVAGLKYGDPRWGRAVPCPDCAAVEPEAERAHRLRRLSGVSDEEWGQGDLTRLDYSQGSPRREVEGWLRNSTRLPILALVGGVGTGKTVCALAVLKTWIGWGRPATFTVMPAWFEQARIKVWDQENKAALDEWRAPLLRDHLVVLDELKGEELSEFKSEQATLIVDHRYRHQLPTVITANVRPGQTPPDQARLWSRVFGDQSQVVLTGGKDRRQG